MRVSKRILCGSLLLLLASSAPLRAQGTTPEETEKSCRAFVQEFYTWYVARALKIKSGDSSEYALRNRASSFSPELTRRLRQDLAASKKAEEIVGLEMDPFLNAQDNAERYVAGKVTPRGEGFWVAVYRLESGKRAPAPDVTPEVVFKDGRWVFVNFHYGKEGGAERENLLSLLKALRLERQKTPK